MQRESPIIAVTPFLHVFLEKRNKTDETCQFLDQADGVQLAEKLTALVW
jgi:hypothetical protein